MYHILLPLDGSEHADRAVDHVIAMQQRCGALKVTLLNVQELGYLQGDAEVMSMTDSISRKLVDAGERCLRGPAERLQAAGIEVATVVESDDPAAAIARQAAQSHCHAIVMGSRGLGRFGELVLGSVAYKTVHLAQVPVTLVKSRTATTAGAGRAQ